MVFRTLFGLLVPLLFSMSGWAETIKVKPEHPDQYTVVKGDTLWGIAGKFLHNPAQWPKVWQENKQLKNPNLIYPGDVIYFSLVNGKPRLSRTPFPSIQKQGQASSEIAAEHEQKLFQPHIRETPIEEAIKLIPVESIAPFLTTPRVVGKNELRNAPYIVQMAGEHLVAGAGDRIYARAIMEPQNLVYTVFRKGKTYTDPFSKEILGYEAQYIATATLQKTGDPATLLITESDREIRRGDRLLSVREGEVALNYFPKPPKEKITGRIISVLEGVYEIGQYDLVVLNKGNADGLRSGHVLDIYQNRAIVSDPFASRNKSASVKLPDEYAGTLMVFRTFERISYALVMNAVGAIHLLDKVTTP